MTVQITNPKLKAFLTALPDAEPDALCSPPGLGAIFKVKHIKTGLERGVLSVHWAGIGLQFASLKGHGVCQACVAAKSRSSCDHCQCKTCVWERQAEDVGGHHVTAEQIARLRARVAAFGFAQRAPLVRLDE